MELRYHVASAVLGLSLALAPSAARAQGVVRLGMVGGILHRKFLACRQSLSSSFRLTHSAASVPAAPDSKYRLT